MHAGAGRPRDAFAGFCGQLPVGWRFCEPGDPQAKGVVERLQGYMQTSFEPGRTFINEHDFQDQLDGWFDARANRRLHRTLRRRPVDLLAEEREALRALPERAPDTGRRRVLRVPPIRTSASTPTTTRSTRRWSGAASRSASISARSPRSHSTPASWPAGTSAVFAKHRTITALEHARALRAQRHGRAEIEVQQRPLARYDALIPA